MFVDSDMTTKMARLVVDRFQQPSTTYSRVLVLPPQVLAAQQQGTPNKEDDQERKKSVEGPKLAHHDHGGK